MVKLIGLEMPPPGAGLVTVTAGAPVEATLAAGMTAVNCEEPPNVVATADPPKLTMEAAMKFVPLIVRMKAALPATVLFGEIVVIVGVGLGVGVGVGVGGGLTVEGVPPPHPARSKRLAIPATASPLASTVSLFMAPSIPFPTPHHRPSARCTTASIEKCAAN
jgi:hypothetical protein